MVFLGDILGNLEQHRLACMRFGDAKEGGDRGDCLRSIGAMFEKFENDRYVPLPRRRQ
jgi:hypothetical protein